MAAKVTIVVKTCRLVNPRNRPSTSRGCYAQEDQNRTVSVP